tara:strand:- start:1866 stop:2471 length:606 start_codon:yes stop_codon:yes gene_type:complete
LIDNSWPIYGSASICIASGFLITGGLHTDGLMDTVDGLYADRKKMLKAMKDSRVGSFGVQAVILTTLIQLGSLIKIDSNIFYTLPLCLFWGRFSTLFYIDRFKYITFKKKSLSHKKYWRGFKKEAFLSIVFLLIIIFYNLISLKSNILLIKFLAGILTGLVLSYLIPSILGKRVGGFNGDTCGASVILTETIMLFFYAVVL